MVCECQIFYELASIRSVHSPWILLLFLEYLKKKLNKNLSWYSQLRRSSVLSLSIKFPPPFLWIRWKVTVLECVWLTVGQRGWWRALQRLIGRSIGGKVTTSVEMERTAHSKSNAASQMFYQNQIRTTVHCQNWCFAPMRMPYVWKYIC